jgi:hypothetical protein
MGILYFLLVILLLVILSEPKNLCNVHPVENAEALRFAQDDNGI